MIARLRPRGPLRVVLLTVWYLAILVALVLVHVSPDAKASGFVYQAF